MSDFCILRNLKDLPHPIPGLGDIVGIFDIQREARQRNLPEGKPHAKNENHQQPFYHVMNRRRTWQEPISASAFSMCSQKVRPEKPKPGRCMNLWVERKWRTIGSDSPRAGLLEYLRLIDHAGRLWFRSLHQSELKMELPVTNVILHFSIHLIKAGKSPQFSVPCLK
jgi:hypothetical protein